MPKKVPFSVKFLIGLVAGLCAALLPRLSAAMVAGSDDGALELFNTNYLLLSAVFATLIGAVTAILEWESSRAPKDIFMSALAIPGIVSGALNTTVGVSNFQQSETARVNMEKVLEKEFEIPTLPSFPLEETSEETSMNFELEILNPLSVQGAFAFDGAIHEVADYGVGIKKSEARFVIVLDRAPSKKEAKKRANALRNVIASPRILPYDKQSFIVTTEVPISKSAALIEAVRLKRLGLKPSLLEVR